MIIRDWLGSYVEVENIASVLARMSSRTSLPPESIFAKKILLENYESYQKEFFEFMPQIIAMVEEKFKIMQNIQLDR